MDGGQLRQAFERGLGPPNLNILALDTSSEWCSAALWLDGRVWARDTRAGQRHSELILVMIDALLREAGVTPRQLHGIGFGAGPGSFTGLRIACGLAQGMAFGAELTLAPIGTLDCLAQASGARRVVSALDARMGEIYHAAYERTQIGWQTVFTPSLCRPQDAPELEGEGWIGCGSGFAAHGEALRQRYGSALDGTQPELYPHARDVAALAAPVFAHGKGVDPALAAPLYIRDKVALSIVERAERKQGAVDEASGQRAG
jgi:tRNA threonylcarbamoyladenosine biosynthesis protein TsaB